MATVRQLINLLEVMIQSGEVKETDQVVLSGDPEGNRYGAWDAVIAVQCLYEEEDREVYDSSEDYATTDNAKPAIVLYPI